MSSFRTRSFLVLPHIHLSMRISATLNRWTCRQNYIYKLQ
uniref:Uncharacterized protein n=1 Tax=Arundo donax TaxID=35708 RepID=A0A0A9EXV4_ARUDO